MTHIDCNVGDVEQGIDVPKWCCPGMCVRKTNQAVLQCAQAFKRLVDKIEKATNGEYLKVAFAERMFVVELHNIGNTIIHGTLPGVKKVRFCGELVLANGAFGYGEASQVYLTYTTPYQFEARDDGPIEYEGHVIQPSFEKRVEVERASADRFGSPLGAMRMCTQKEVVKRCFAGLLETAIHPQCNFSLRLVELACNKMHNRHHSRSAKEVLLLV